MSASQYPPLDPTRDVQTQVVHRDGKVVMLFSKRVDGQLVPSAADHLMLDPDAALYAAELLSAMAFEADTNLKPVGDTLKASLIEKHRRKLKGVFETVLRSGINKRLGVGKMATQLLDEMCKEVF